MAYSDFTLDRLIREFGVKVRGERSLFPAAAPIEPSAWLIESLQRANNVGFGSEKSRSERLVSPVLVELSSLNQDAFAILSGANLDVDASRGLSGECDFILSFTRLQDLVQAPVFCITEAKKQDIEMGTAQCAAQLLGAAQLNREAQKPIPTLFGCSTTGVEWRFLRFEDNTFVIDETRYLINEPAKLLGVLQQVVDWQLFAQKSTPLEGVYYSPRIASQNGYSQNILRFYRDGTFLESSIGGVDEVIDMVQVASWLNVSERNPSGTYTLADGELLLNFERSKQKCVGKIDEDGILHIARFIGQKQLVYQHYK
jgi:hypothetical protein